MSAHRKTHRPRQYCSSPKYNAKDYTREMFYADRRQNHCRLWTPKRTESVGHSSVHREEVAA
jgi:hypothetical protein